MSKWAVTLGGGLHHEVSSRHNRRRLWLSHTIRLRLNIFFFQNWTYNLKGLFLRRGIKGLSGIEPTSSKSLFWTWPLYHFVSSVDCRVSATLFWSSGVYATPMITYGIYTNPMQTAGVYATHVQSGWVSALTRTNVIIGFSLRQSTFSSLAYKTRNFRSTCHEDGFTSDPNDFTTKSKNLTPNSKNTFCNPILVMINSLSCRAINPESHPLQEEKAKRGR